MARTLEHGDTIARLLLRIQSSLWRTRTHTTLTTLTLAYAEAASTAVATQAGSACPKCSTIKKSGQRSCCFRGGAWFKNCGDVGDTRFEHTWGEGIQACKDKPVGTIDIAVFSLPLPCEEASDFTADVDLGDGQTCRNVAAFVLPWTSDQCGDMPDGSVTKADMLKYLYSKCCKPGSKPNSICGFKSALPCEKASDFNANIDLGDGQTCYELSSVLIPLTADQCSEVPEGGGSVPKADMLKYLYGKCCKPDSKPNNVCGLKPVLPCENASDFYGDIEFGGGQTCRDVSALALPLTANECEEEFSVSGQTKGEVLKHTYARCCRLGSEPNGMCGFKSLVTSTPCESKAEGEFLPKTM